MSCTVNPRSTLPPLSSAPQRPPQPANRLTLADLARGRWTVVATSSRPGVWDYVTDQRALYHAREAGHVPKLEAEVAAVIEGRARA